MPPQRSNAASVPGNGLAERLADRVIAAAALAVLAPVLLLAAAAVRASSPGPVIYRARRAGLHGRPFVLYKFRTMHVAPPGTGSAITAGRDARVFPVGAWLRHLKIDELPQLLNVLRGDMALVGPRPEDPDIVARHYAPLHHETLQRLPGLTSVASSYYYGQLERTIDANDPERDYIERVLPIKLAVDIVGCRRASLLYNLRVVASTARVLGGKLIGQRDFPDPPELAIARKEGLIVPAVAPPD